MRPNLVDNIFARAHSLQRPPSSQKFSIFITDNLSRDYFFSNNKEENFLELSYLTHEDWESVTHFWFWRYKKIEYEADESPLGLVTK